MWAKIISWLTSSALDRVFSTIDNAVNNETTREQVKTDLAKTYVAAQVSTLTGKGWWFPLLFLVPAGLWFTSVCIYSVLFCSKCVFPQTWIIAALPSPLYSWMGAIVGSLFIGKAGEQIIARLK